MFNYSNTHLVEEKSLIESGVSPELSNLLECCMDVLIQLSNKSTSENLVPANIVLHEILSVVFYLSSYLRANNINITEYLQAFERGVIENLKSTGGGVKTNVIWNRPMFVANRIGGTQTMRYIYELLEQDIRFQAENILNQEENDEFSEV